MDRFPGDLRPLIFKRTLKNSAKDIRLNGQMLKVFVEIDGIKNLGVIADTLDMDPENLRRVIRRLSDLELIETEQPPDTFLDSEFFRFLAAELTLAVGPIAAYIIEDEVRKFGADSAKVPRSRAAELVDLLSRQIQRHEKKIAFQQALVRKIRELTQ